MRVEGIHRPCRLSCLFLIVLQLVVPGSCLDDNHDSAICTWNIGAGFPSMRQVETYESWETCPPVGNQVQWSQPPTCLEQRDEQDEEEDSPVDCVFTLATYRHHRGISIITTPDLSGSLAAHLDDSILSPELRINLSRPVRPELPYEIQDIRGRGKGLIATRDISKYETIMIDFPALVVRLGFINEEQHTQRQKRRLMQKGVSQLPAARKGAVMGLARSRGGDLILDILQTNGFGIEIGGVQHLALFPEGSRINHNCRPNAYWRYVNSNMAMEVVALRDIRAGEEIAHSYAPLGNTYQQRKAILQAWGFRCSCPLCTASPAERDASDRRRERLVEIHGILGQASELGDSRRIGQLVLEAVGLIEKEELEPQLVEYYQQFAKAYIMTGDFGRAREFVKLADQLWVLYGGEEHENVEGMRQLWQALEEAERDAEDD
ncbi:hypothetical protein VTK26DRAFT_1588 [Humicola hyalothermophila]